MKKISKIAATIAMVIVASMAVSTAAQATTLNLLWFGEVRSGVSLDPGCTAGQTSVFEWQIRPRGATVQKPGNPLTVTWRGGDTKKGGNWSEVTDGGVKVWATTVLGGSGRVPKTNPATGTSVYPVEAGGNGIPALVLTSTSCQGPGV